MIYLDNAATSWPKPPKVLRAMTGVLERIGGNPGRSGHSLSIEAARVVYDTREVIARFFNSADPRRIIFTMNATHGINIALRGILRAGDRVVTTSMEHNAVMRPLRYLQEKAGVVIQVVPCRESGELNIADVEQALAAKAKLVVINHASNITGTILPVSDIARMAHRAGALLLVDAAQTAGVLPIDATGMGIDLLAFTGHKGLLGPPGIGGLVIGQQVDFGRIEPLILGGTGSQSEMEIQPEHLPDKFESGTQNIAGIAGLQAGIQWILERGIGTIRTHEMELTEQLIDGLSDIPGITLYGPRNPALSTAIVSLTVAEKPVSEIGLELDEKYGMLCRVGLHCAPAAHRTIGSFPGGTVRLAPGVFTSTDDIHRVVNALSKVAVA
jgi:cysteine desulfurase / selenocysteine lyase